MKCVALGGGGFSTMLPDVSPLDEYVLNLASVTKPRICFLPTASGDSKGYIERYYQAFSKLNCEPTHLELFKRNIENLNDYIQQQDILYVGGGNTANMLAVWETQGLLPIIKKYWQYDKVLAGISAGAACWFSWCLTDSFKSLNVHECLGYIDAGFCPHYDSEPDRKIHFPTIVEQRGGIGYAVEDGAALCFSNGKLDQVVSEIKSAKAYCFESGAMVVVKPLKVQCLV